MPSRSMPRFGGWRLSLAMLGVLAHAGVAAAHEHPVRHVHARAPAFPGESFLENAGVGLDVLKGAIVIDDAYYDLMARAGDAAFPEDPDGLRRASPLHNVEAGKGIPPFLILHAGRREYREQSEAMGAALEQAGVPVEVAEVQGKTHLTIIGDMGRPQDPVTLLVRHFLDSLELEAR